MESLFDDISSSSLKETIIQNYAGDLDTRDGSFFDFCVSPLTYALYSTYKDMEEFLSVMFPDAESGEWLDLECAKYGITRKTGTKAGCTVTLTGTDGAIIPAGTVFMTEDGLSYTLDADAVLTGGTGSGTLTAADVGADYNVAAGEISRMYVNAAGLTAWANARAVGGTDTEDSESLYQRLASRRMNPSSSGCAADYKQWALSIDGIGAAHVEPLWNGNGTVKVFLASDDLRAVDSAKVSEAAAYIETVRPIGAAVTVASCTEVAISVTAQLVMDGSVALADIKTAFSAALTEYLTGIGIDSGSVVTSHVGYILSGLDGVTDYSGLTVNGGTANIALAAGQVAVEGTTTLS